MKIAIIVPMEEEAEFYKKHFKSETKEVFGTTEFDHFSINGNDIYLGLSGIGKVNAAMNLTSLLTKEDIDLVFMTGSAGSMQENVKRKDLILVDSFAYHDAHCVSAGEYVEGQIPREPARFNLKSPVREAFKKYLLSQNVDFKEGLVVTGDTFVQSEAQKDEIKKNFSDALGVEMEGAAFAQVARHFNTPLVAIRAISDNGDANADNDFDKFVKEVGAKAASVISSYLEETVLD